MMPDTGPLSKIIGTGFKMRHPPFEGQRMDAPARCSAAMEIWPRIAPKTCALWSDSKVFKIAAIGCASPMKAAHEGPRKKWRIYGSGHARGGDGGDGGLRRLGFILTGFAQLSGHIDNGSPIYAASVERLAGGVEAGERHAEGPGDRSAEGRKPGDDDGGDGRGHDPRAACPLDDVNEAIDAHDRPASGDCDADA